MGSIKLPEKEMRGMSGYGFSDCYTVGGFCLFACFLILFCGGDGVVRG